MEDKVLKLVEFHSFDDSVGLGINVAWQTLYRNYQLREKIKWVSVTLVFLKWQVTLRHPIKEYGIREV